MPVGAIFPDGTHLLDVLDGHVWAGVVFDQIRPVCILALAGVFFVSRAFREADLIVFLVVLEPVLLPRDRAPGVFFVDAVAVLVVVVAFAVARRIIPLRANAPIYRWRVKRCSPDENSTLICEDVDPKLLS